ncbi:MAG: succinate dehydrogenase cytochrome b subunit [Desulfobacterium sp.]|nr:succinate dehydrogenase cytochrome b subunit [Desulfobacterium sp.]MBU4011125.1 succinate dehydrogenase cytochrome b subunit [Pseudomonadota bacterium]MBU4036123.1 succinate dehydrogenase cytochrome b subunit [Pseudomonadota bacterium]
MNWFIKTLTSSIGKKWLMAITGLIFCGFLTSHLLGNLTLYAGRDAFNSYAEHLHSLGILISVTEKGLLFFGIIHVLTGLVLFIQNIKSRPVKYSVNKNAGGRTIGSATMPYTGLILIAFIVLHLVNFHFVDKTGTTIFQIVQDAFSKPLYIISYVFAVIVVALHVSHGFWSAFQTLGVNHPKYMPFIKKAGIAFSLLVGLGFGFIPVFISLTT